LDAQEHPRLKADLLKQTHAAGSPAAWHSSLAESGGKLMTTIKQSLPTQLESKLREWKSEIEEAQAKAEAAQAEAKAQQAQADLQKQLWSRADELKNSGQDQLDDLNDEVDRLVA
jgi:chromosome segregation ATPase